jgi:hypothetical protein
MHAAGLFPKNTGNRKNFYHDIAKQCHCNTIAANIKGIKKGKRLSFYGNRKKMGV